MKDRLNCLLSEVGESFDAPPAAMSGTSAGIWPNSKN